jgi:hypothetical protein
VLLMIISFINTTSITLDPFNGSESTCRGFCSLFHYAFIMLLAYKKRAKKKKKKITSVYKGNCYAWFEFHPPSMDPFACHPHVPFNASLCCRPTYQKC